MNKIQPALRGFVFAGLVSALGACNNESLAPSTSTDANTPTASDAVGPAGINASTLAATLRVRCERRSNRSKISVDGNNLVPRNGRFRARVQASGGTVVSAFKRAVGDEAEFDFDSNPNDIAAGATRIPPRFITRRPGPDVIGVILNAQGQVVARQGVECTFR